VITGAARLNQSPQFSNFVFDVENNALGLTPGRSPDPSILATSPALSSGHDVYVQSWWPPGGVAQLVVSFNNNGVWTTPAGIPSPVNSNVPGCYADNAFVVGTKTSFRLYFESKRLNGTATACGGNSRIWRTDFTTSGGFTTPVLVPGLSTSSSIDEQV